jgi:hypothetical protein
VAVVIDALAADAEHRIAGLAVLGMGRCMIVEQVAGPAGTDFAAGVMQRKLRLIALAAGEHTHILADQDVAGDTWLGFV